MCDAMYVSEMQQMQQIQLQSMSNENLAAPTLRAACIVIGKAFTAYLK